jgi:hypothetical protein
LPANYAVGRLYSVLAPSPPNSDERWVLRVQPGAQHGDWWRAARRRNDAPASISALLHGRARLEVTPDEATQAIEWAAAIEGWSTAAAEPLFIHQPVANDIS